nr:MAG TPA: replication protein [Inoviridae sp.]
MTSDNVPRGTLKKRRKNMKKRYWAFVLYPESAPGDK